MTFDWPIFDRVGYVARAYGEQNSATLAGFTDPDGPVDRLRASWNVATWLGERTVPDFITGADLRTDLRIAFDSLSAMHQSYYVVRQQLMAALASEPRLRYFAVAPSVSVLTLQGDADDEDGLLLQMDRVHDEPVTFAGANAADQALWAVSAVEAERYTVATPAVAAGEMTADTLRPDAAGVLRSAAQSPIRLLRSTDAARALEWDASDEARTRMYFDLRDGATLLAPEKPFAFEGELVSGWWMVAPVSGRLTDEMETGGHQAGPSTAECKRTMPRKPPALAALEAGCAKSP